MGSEGTLHYNTVFIKYHKHHDTIVFVNLNYVRQSVVISSHTILLSSENWVIFFFQEITMYYINNQHAENLSYKDIVSIPGLLQ